MNRGLAVKLGVEGILGEGFFVEIGGCGGGEGQERGGGGEGGEAAGEGAAGFGERVQGERDEQRDGDRDDHVVTRLQVVVIAEEGEVARRPEQKRGGEGGEEKAGAPE